MTTKRVTLLVDDSIAKELEEKGLAEIALRRQNARFERIIKCDIDERRESKTFDNAMEILEKTLDISCENKATLGKANHAINHLDKNVEMINGHISAISNQMSDLSGVADRMYGYLRVTSFASIFNAGLSIVDIGINIAGFRRVQRHLESIENQLKTVLDGIEDLKNISKAELKSEYTDILLDYSTILDQIECNDIDIKDLRNTVKRICTYITKIILNINDETFDINTLLSLVYPLIPLYAVVLCLLLKEHYLKYKKMPNGYSQFMNVFDSLIDPDFLSKQKKYWFIQQDENINSTYAIINYQKMMVINCVSQIHDWVKVLQRLKTREEIDRFEKITEEAANKRITEIAPDVAALLNKNPEEVVAVLQSATQKYYL